jgi:hypothetical protein
MAVPDLLCLLCKKKYKLNFKKAPVKIGAFLFYQGVGKLVIRHIWDVEIASSRLATLTD